MLIPALHTNHLSKMIKVLAAAAIIVVLLLMMRGQEENFIPQPTRPMPPALVP
jgi:hypothetical protein